MRQISVTVANLPLALQVRSAPMLAHWFLLDTLLLANKANRAGMHANSLVLTRRCVEAISIIELGLCRHAEAEAILLKWEVDELSAGKLRAWLESNVWPRYGTGLWAEPWCTFMGEFAKAIQPYAHYSRSLAQWQARLHGATAGELLIELKPRGYDPQKATRITLFHEILHFALGRIWMASNPDDREIAALIARLGHALGEHDTLTDIRPTGASNFGRWCGIKMGERYLNKVHPAISSLTFAGRAPAKRSEPPRSKTVLPRRGC